MPIVTRTVKLHPLEGYSLGIYFLTQLLVVQVVITSSGSTQVIVLRSLTENTGVRW